MSAENIWFSEPTKSKGINWRGQSGSYYALAHEPLEDFHMSDSSLYILAHNGTALWVGSSHDLIADYTSRHQFKVALKTCSHVFSNMKPVNDAERQHMAWDIASGRQAGRLELVKAS